MKVVNIFYWICTGLICALMLFSAYTSIFTTPEAIKFMHDSLGYPVYIIPFLGVAKVLGVIALLVPGFPRLREWAYAGFVIDLVGAFYSVVKTGGHAGDLAPFIVFFALIAGSYILYHKRLKVAAGVK